MQKNSFKINFSTALLTLFACTGLLLSYLYWPHLQTPAAADTVSALYPNLKTLPPRDLRFDRTDVSVDGSGVMHNVLRFSNTVYNVGEGRVDIRAVIDPVTLNGDAYQRVYNTDNTYVDYLVGTLYYHAQHRHYHFENWGEYQLWTKADYDDFVASGSINDHFKKLGVKTTSCIMDEEFVIRLFNTHFPGTSGICQPDSQNNIIEVLSSGWGDTYDYDRYEQWVDLDQETLTDGDYVLRSISDPLNIMVESANKADVSRESIADNEAITPFTVSGGEIIDSLAPSGTIFINNADISTVLSTVTVNVLGRDDVSGVDQVRLSNDGVTWASYPYTGVESVYQSISWSLTNPTYGGTSLEGSKTVYAQFRDRSGKLSPVQSTTIYLDLPTSAYSVAILADSPVSYWRLSELSGESAADSEFANSGTYIHEPALAVPGLILSDAQGKAVDFDGVNDFVFVNNASSLNIPSALTLEAWINPASLPAAGSFRSVITKPDSYSLQFDGPKIEFAMMQTDRSWQRLQSAAGALTAGQKYHLVGTYDGVMQRLYVNGIQIASQPVTGDLATGTSNLYIASWDGTHEYFAGTIDDPAIYPIALSAADIESHYDVGMGIPTPTRTATATKTATKTPTSTPTKTSTPTPAPVSITLSSIAAQDGWVLESAETSGMGGTVYSGGPALNIGDSVARQQYRSIISFNTGGLPDTAVITGATLKVKKNGFIGGTDPINTFHGLMVDIKTGFFDTFPALQALDFQAVASKTLGPTNAILSGGFYNLGLINGKDFINKLAADGGLTQIRLRFVLDDNNDAVANYLSLYSGEAATAADRPQLVIRYYMP